MKKQINLNACYLYQYILRVEIKIYVTAVFKDMFLSSLFERSEELI